MYGSLNRPTSASNVLLKTVGGEAGSESRRPLPEGLPIHIQGVVTRHLPSEPFVSDAQRTPEFDSPAGEAPFRHTGTDRVEVRVSKLVPVRAGSKYPLTTVFIRSNLRRPD